MQTLKLLVMASLLNAGVVLFAIVQMKKLQASQNVQIAQSIQTSQIEIIASPTAPSPTLTTQNQQLY